MKTPTNLEPVATAGAAPMMQSVESFEAWVPLSRSAYQKLADAFGEVPAERWESPTPCEGWTIRDLAGHMVGAMRSAASVRESVRQQRAFKKRAKRTGEQEVDAMTALQIELAADLTVVEVVAELQSLVEPAVAGRQKMPGFVRRRAEFFVEMGEIAERWTFDYFLSTILTRDAWLHRVDLADALGTTLDLGPADRAIVADVAAEWSERHGQPVNLTLTGEAGGSLVVGDQGPTLELDAIEFCRIVSGRTEPTHELLATPVPF